MSGIVNATSLAFDRDGELYVSSRFEGNVYRVKAGEGSSYGGGKIIDTAVAGPPVNSLLLLD